MDYASLPEKFSPEGLQQIAVNKLILNSSLIFQKTIKNA